MKSAELVTIVCIAFNHESWIEETLESVRLQDYQSKELIVVDNGSTDGTAAKIRQWVNLSSGRLSIRCIFNEEVVPYCRLFNSLLAPIKGKYIVDLSGDDVLYPEHLSASVLELQRAPDAAFVFSDAYILDERGEVKTFYKRNLEGELAEEIEISEIFPTLIRRNFICSPTVVFNTEILRKEGGYDESLYYEDFDIQIRLAGKYPVVFSDHIGVLKRKHSGSMSAGQYLRYQSKMLPSTVKVCDKILAMDLSQEEQQSLKVRIVFELKHALWSANFDSAMELVVMGERLGIRSLRFWFYKLWAKKRWDISWLYVQLT